MLGRSCLVWFLGVTRNISEVLPSPTKPTVPFVRYTMDVHVVSRRTKTTDPSYPVLETGRRFIGGGSESLRQSRRISHVVC
jgi:hypothetical protein